jgi:hypothetical protein
MSFSLLPTEIKDYVSGFIIPSKLSREEIRSCGRNILQLSLVNHELKNICDNRLSVFKRVHGLLAKYFKYQGEYENPGKDWHTGREFDPKGNPQLLDALFTGCTLPFAGSTFNTFNQEIEDDIKEIVKLTPQSVNCILGRLRCRDEVTPLVAASINPNIPVHIVELLLESGANPNATIKLNGYPIHILKDLKDNLDSERFSKIEELFKKYGVEV